MFATDTLGFSPEWFSRIGGELYLAGLNSTMIPLPDVATDVEINPSAMEQLKDCAKAMVGTVDGKNMEVMREALVRKALLDRFKVLMLTDFSVFPSCDGKWPPHRMSRARRAARWWLEDSWGRGWWSLHCGRPRCLGYLAIAWHWTRHVRIDRRSPYVREPVGIGLAILICLPRPGISASFF